MESVSSVDEWKWNPNDIRKELSYCMIRSSRTVFDLAAPTLNGGVSRGVSHTYAQPTADRPEHVGR